jgi:hypothetical protein
MYDAAWLLMATMVSGSFPAFLVVAISSDSTFHTSTLPSTPSFAALK